MIQCFGLYYFCFIQLTSTEVFMKIVILSHMLMTRLNKLKSKILILHTGSRDADAKMLLHRLSRKNMIYMIICKHHKRKTYIRKLDKIELNGLKIEKSKTVWYLGVKLDPSLNFRQEMKHIIRTISVAITKICQNNFKANTIKYATFAVGFLSNVLFEL